MRLVPNKAYIRSKKVFKHVIFSKLNRRKNFLSKFLFTLYTGKGRILKQHYVFSKKKRFFVQRNLDRKFFVLKQKLKLNCLHSSYNLLVVMRSQQEYLRMKNDLVFSQLGLLDFKFWHLKKEWIRNLFKTNKKFINNLSVLNGSLLILQTKTLKSLLETFLLFEHKSVSCVGFFVFNRLVWPSYFLQKVETLPKGFSNVKNNFFSCLKLIFKKLTVMQLFLSSLFKLIINKNANVFAINV